MVSYYNRRAVILSVLAYFTTNTHNLYPTSKAIFFALSKNQIELSISIGNNKGEAVYISWVNKFKVNKTQDIYTARVNQDKLDPNSPPQKTFRTSRVNIIADKTELEK